MTVGGIRIQVVRKGIKNLHLGVYPPSGRVRVAAPNTMDYDAIRLAVVGKIGWIKRQKARFSGQPRQSKREMVSGESHYVFGRRYRLNVIAHNGPCGVALRGNSRIDLLVPPGTTARQREAVLNCWHRERLRAVLPALLDKWQKVLGVRVVRCGIKKMKTKWGSCNTVAHRIWVNLELAKKPRQCLEYIIAHELTHLLERHHNSRFISIMDEHLPRWRSHRQLLNAQPLANEEWIY